MRTVLVPAALAAVALLAAPGVASADSIFDPADADALAASLAEATAAQGVCYGWNIDVYDQSSYSSTGSDDSVGSDQGAGKEVSTSCDQYVELKVDITWTSESSESDDSASWSLNSSGGGPTEADMEALELDLDELDGDNPDVPLAQMISALPLLAADKGMAQMVEAAPATGEPPADAKLTDSPGSDWWRSSGGMVLWGGGILLAGGVFAWWVMRSNRGREQLFPRKEPKDEVPDTIPDYLTEERFPKADDARTANDTASFPADITEPAAGVVRPEPPTEPFPAAEADPPTAPFPAAEPEPTVEPKPDVEPERPTDQKDKE